MTEETTQTTIEDAGAVGGIRTEVAEYTKTAAALARLEFRMKDVVHDVTTTKGMDAAKKDVSELRTLRTTLDKKRLELNEDDQARIKRRNEEAKRITARIEGLEDPIKEQIKVEVQRKEDEKIAKAQREKDRQDALRTRIDTMAGLALRAVGKPSAYVAEKIVLLEVMTTDDFEEMTPVAVNTKADTLAKLRELLAASESHEVAVADLAESRLREEAQRSENERLEREAQERREAEDAAERSRQAKAQAESKFREDVSAIVLNAIGQTAGELEAVLFNLDELNGRGDAVVFEAARNKLVKMHSETLRNEKLAAEAAQHEAERLAEEKLQREAIEAEQRAQAQREQDEREARELAERQRLERIRLENEAARSALEKAAPRMLQLLMQTTVFLDTIIEDVYVEEAKRLHDEIMVACGDLRPVLDDQA